MVALPAAILAAVCSLDASAEPMAARVGARTLMTAEAMSPGDFGRYADAEPKRRPLGEAVQNGPQAQRGSRASRFSGAKPGATLEDAAGGTASSTPRRTSLGGAVSGQAPTSEQIRRTVFETTVSELSRGAVVPDADGYVAPPAGSLHWSSDVVGAVARQARRRQETSSFETRDYSHHLGPWGRETLPGAAAAATTTASSRRSSGSRSKSAGLTGTASAPWVSISSGGLLLQQGGVALFLLGLSAPIRRRLKQRKADPGLVDRLS